MVYRKIPQRFAKECVTRAAARYIVNEELKTFNDAVYPQLPFKIRAKPYRMKTNLTSPHGHLTAQLFSYTYTVTDLFRDERIVLTTNRATEVRTHAERLIVEALRHGDRHRATMALVDYWLRDKALIHKLFKVFVPRYENWVSAFTALHHLGPNYEHGAQTLTELKENSHGGNRFHKYGESVLEMRGNSLPPIIRPKLDKTGLLHNVLLKAARTNYAREAALGASDKS